MSILKYHATETREQRNARIRKAVETRQKNKQKLIELEESNVNKKIELKLLKQIQELTDKLNNLKREEECLSISLPLLKKTLLREHEIVKNSSLWNNALGIYFLIKNEKVVYVGQSKNVLTRISFHKDKNFDSYAFLPCEEHEMDIIESLYIHLLQPEQNGTSVHGVIFSPMTLEQMLKKLAVEPSR